MKPQFVAPLGERGEVELALAIGDCRSNRPVPLQHFDACTRYRSRAVLTKEGTINFAESLDDHLAAGAQEPWLALLSHSRQVEIPGAFRDVLQLHGLFGRELIL